MMTPLSALPLEIALQSLPEWQIDALSLSISRNFVFDDFVNAFGFMQLVALQAQHCDHHPEWSNVYNTVHIRWTSHDAGGVTDRDIAMASFCDSLLASTPGSAYANG
jgi:4a-hydroxytetrahydrobiopterin dehydratase